MAKPASRQQLIDYCLRRLGAPVLEINVDDDQIDDLVDDVRRDPEAFLNEHGLDWENFIDKDEFIQGVIDADGYGHTLNGYDGSADEMNVQGNWYYVMRID